MVALPPLSATGVGYGLLPIEGLLPMEGTRFGAPLQNLLVAIVALAVIVLVGRFVLSVGWKLLIVDGVIVAALYLLSLLGL